MNNSSKDIKSKNVKANTKSIMNAFNVSLPPDKSVYDFLLEELPSELLLVLMEVTRKANESPARILGAPARPHYSLKANPFTNEELRDINERYCSSYKKGM